MRKALALLLLAAVLPAHAAITLFGAALSPADSSSQSGTAAVTITHPASMVSGQLVYVFVAARGNGHSFSVSTTGGQSWTKDCEDSTITPSVAVFHAIYNGTWTANPQFDAPDHTSSAMSAHMLVYAPSTLGVFSNTPDVACVIGQDSSVGTHTAASQSPTGSASTVTIQAWAFSGLDTLSGLTAGWTTRGSDDDLQNTAGSGLTTSLADKIQSSASATGSVSETQDTFANSAQMPTITFRETTSSMGFTAGPSYAKVDGNTIRATFTCSSGSPTVRGGLWTLNATAPTGAEIIAGTNAHGTASVMCTGSSQTLDIDASDSPPLPGYDPYIVLDVGGTPGTVPATTHTCVDPPAGFQFPSCPTGLSSIGTGSPADTFNAADIITLPYDTQTANFHVGDVLVDTTSGAWGFVLVDADSGATGTLTVDKRNGTFSNNDALADQQGGAALVNGSESAYTSIAAGDILVAPSATSPGSAVINVDSTGQFSYSATGRQSAANTLVYDASAAAYLSVDLDLFFNNQAPQCQKSAHEFVVGTGDAITAINLNDLCTDADGDALTCGQIVGTLPADLVFDPATCTISGVPSEANTDGVDLEYVVADTAFAADTVDLTITTVDHWAAPSCVGALATDCVANLFSLTHNAIDPDTTYVCSDHLASGLVTAQSPDAGTDLMVGDSFAIAVSIGICGNFKMPNCLSKSVDQCQLLVVAQSPYASVTSGTGCSSGTSTIYSQAPAANTRQPYNQVLLVYCH